MASNNEMNLAWQYIEGTNTSVFLTGKAGTGKTTFLNKLKELSPKRIVVVAPTGIAAINCGGVTIHSFFQLPLSPFIPDMSYRNEGNNYYRFSKEKKNIIKTMDLLIIDEISMVRCDLLDAIDSIMRKYRDRSKPFGGVQLLMIGDLQQLSPIATDNEIELLEKYYDSLYFFESKALRAVDYITIELKQIYRQTDTVFIELLEKIRTNTADSTTVSLLNQRFIPENQLNIPDGYIRLTTHNNIANKYNERKLKDIDEAEYSFKAQISGNFPEYSYPNDEYLTLKKGAQVMFIKNDISGEKRYFNGKIGIVCKISQHNIYVQCENEQAPIPVDIAEWSNSKYIIDEESHEIKEVTEGVYKQYPLKLAWAITIHKSQGLTFDNAVLDINESFAHGQVYVALSRCRTLEGMILTQPINPDSIITDSRVNEYIRKEEQKSYDSHKVLESKRFLYFNTLLDELFFFGRMKEDLSYLIRITEEHLSNLFPIFLKRIKEADKSFDEKITDVSVKFRTQYQQILLSTADYKNDQRLQERVMKASNYFSKTLHDLFDNLINSSNIQIENKVIKKQFANAWDTFFSAVKSRTRTFEIISDNGFSISKYLNAKAESILTTEKSSKTSKEKSIQRNLKNGNIQKYGETNSTANLLNAQTDSDITDTQLFDKLRAWRQERAQEAKLPAYCIVAQKALINIANIKPNTMSELISIPYFGKKTADKYGEDILNIIKKNG